MNDWKRKQAGDPERRSVSQRAVKPERHFPPARLLIGPTLMLFAVAFFMAAESTSGATLYSAVYHYNARGAVTNLIETYPGSSPRNRFLRYDTQGRLIEEQMADFQVQYQYDHLGNRVRQTRSGEETEYRYNARNEQLTEHRTGELVNTLSYDWNGSLTQTVALAVYTSYAWNSRGKLKSVSRDG